MLRRLYDWTMRLAGSRHAPTALAGVSFVESSIFPIPPDALLLPMSLARRDRAWLYALICTIASVLGGAAGYAIGFFLFETVGQAIVEFYGAQEKFAEFRAIIAEWDMWFVAGAGFTPFPYKVITIASGAMELNFLTFMLASAMSRGARFFLVSGLAYYFGEPARAFVEKNLGWVTAAAFALLIGGFAAVRLLA